MEYRKKYFENSLYLKKKMENVFFLYFSYKVFEYFPKNINKQ
jgi:hypothetical protein